MPDTPEKAPEAGSMSPGDDEKRAEQLVSGNQAQDSSATESVDPAPDQYQSSLLRRILTPKNCRWDERSPPAFTTGLCLLYAISATFTVANLYYNQPILDKIADTFSVTHEESSQVPTLLQSGYAAGLIFVLPLGDMVERRPFIISLVFTTATLWIALCITESFTAFRAISFICGVITVTPQLMIPLVGDFAPPARRGAALSIVVSGLLLGMLVARLLSGIVANFTSWRNVYWIACASQYMLGVLLYLFMPDYPSTNKGNLSYLGALWSIPKIVVTEPVLVQSCLISFTLAAIFTSFWTTLTFLLVSPPYEYSTLVIGLFALVSIAALVLVPIYGRIIDRFVPLFSIVLAQLVILAGVLIGTFTGTTTVAGPIIQAMFTDIGLQTTQVANRAAIFGINPKARNRVNTAYMAASFSGQLTGTAVGNRLYAQGGWLWSGGCSIGLAAASILFSLARGPRETGWVGWRGGWRLKKDP